MGKRKIICGNNSCKHYSGDGMCDTNIVLDAVEIQQNHVIII